MALHFAGSQRTEMNITRPACWIAVLCSIYSSEPSCRRDGYLISRRSLCSTERMGNASENEIGLTMAGSI